MKKKNQLLAILAVGFLAGPMVAQAQYDYQQLDYPGAPDTQVFGINDRANVVGNGFDGLGTYPFVYGLQKGAFTDVAPLAGYSSTSVLGINGRGDMVGSVTSLDESTISGFIRDKKGNFTVFDHPDALSFTNARGINNGGLVTGFRDVDDFDVATVGFIYDSMSDTFTDLIPTSFFTIAHGINKKGEVVGGSSFFEENDPCPDLGNRYGWFRATDGIVTYFEVNGSLTRARGITDEGLIVGFFFDPNDGKFKGFITELNGPPPCRSITVAADDVIEFPGADATFPEGINKAGDIVGSYDDLTNSHGFIATPQ